MRTSRLAAALAVLSGVVFFFAAPGPAFALSSGCSTSSICTPQAVGMMAELNGTMTPAESAAMAQIANANTIGSGATAAQVGSSLPVGVAATSTAGGFSWSAILANGFPLLGFAPLLLGGLGASQLTLPDDLSGLPSGSSGASGLSSADWSTYPMSGAPPAWTLDAQERVTGYSWRPSGASVDLYRVDLAQPAMTATQAMQCWEGTACVVGSVNWRYVGAYSGGFADFPVDYATSRYYFKVNSTGIRMFANPAPTTSSNPPRWVEQTVTCSRADGSTHTITFQSSPAEAVAGAVITVAGLLCPAGEFAESSSSKLKTEGGTDVDLGGQPHPDTSSIPRACASGSVSACGLRLQYDADPSSARQWRTCPTGVTSACTGWKEDPNKRDDYQCQLGVGSTWTVVALSSCTPIPTDPDPIPDPWVDVDTPESFCSFGLSDFLTGLVVFKAVGCALVWAFVPKTPWDVATSPVTTAVNGSVVGDVSTASDAWVGPFTDLSGESSGDCLGPPITVNNPAPGGGRPALLIDHIHPWSACGPVAAQISAVWIPLASFVTLFSALYIGANSIMRSVGAGVSFADDAQSFDRDKAGRRGN